ncbi:RNA polymerase sigma-70 factor (ECF subfamily) [Aquimarina sp. MAR_2010_214]|uniref:RNA polymerase sigma factor n=1 Tax=Aquimarina sp. MAR_2010_214 TaxID=1250026 RepID=UPI000C712FD8|nr:RNA polymerase sigma factor [Aquimarina sp. MAR_2010_214]PKV49878.1 RNA polymerase sigma-70 factor (ECF subfamily) [Aquimarina sp. MAR_2010_214]
MEPIKINDYKTHKISDSDVIFRIHSGEKELYEILLRRNNQKLYRVIRSYIDDLTEIEDIMQNTYLKAYEKLHQFKHNSQFSTWLIRIGINETLARLKTKGKYLNLYKSENSVSNDFILEIPDAEQLNPEKKMIRQEAKQILEKTIDLLDVKYRTVYVLREAEGMSMAEISDCLGLTVSNVKVRLHRAKDMIREELYELSLDTDIFEFGFSKCDTIVDKVMKTI